MRTPCADAAAHDAHGELIRLGMRRRETGVALTERQVHAFRRNRFAARQVEQLVHQVFGHRGGGSEHAEVSAAAANLDIQPVFEQPQVFIERAAQIREPQVVRRLEVEFACGLFGVRGH